MLLVDVPARYVDFKPLSQVVQGERPEIVIFLVDPDRLSARKYVAKQLGPDLMTFAVPLSMFEEM